MLLNRVCEGRLTHRRSAPVVHSFEYPVWMLLVDIDDLAHLGSVSRLLSVDARNILELRTNDFLEGPGSLRQRVDRCSTLEGVAPTSGPVLLLTTPRCWGYSFNPVSFFLCLDHTGRRIERVVAEVENTPWKQRHVYVLHTATPGPSVQFEARKALHVSPFNDMDLTYRWRFDLHDDAISVAMAVLGATTPHFSATLRLDCKPLTPRAVRRGAFLYPAQSAHTLARIYGQALRLWLKRAPFYVHPDKGATHERTRPAK